jgi:hypothetical protein
MPLGILFLDEAADSHILRAVPHVSSIISQSEALLSSDSESSDSDSNRLDRSLSEPSDVESNPYLFLGEASPGVVAPGDPALRAVLGPALSPRETSSTSSSSRSITLREEPSPFLAWHLNVVGKVFPAVQASTMKTSESEPSPSLSSSMITTTQGAGFCVEHLPSGRSRDDQAGAPWRPHDIATTSKKRSPPAAG